MKRSLVLVAAALLAACGPSSETGQPPAAENTPTDTAALEGVPRAGVVDAVRQRADQAEADMAERARQAEQQVLDAQGGAQQP